ncbi:MAG: lipopolysaccharide biosynthesis protein [Candidatus Glassbacteria bacterium]
MRISSENLVPVKEIQIWPHFRRILTKSILYGAGNVATGFLHLAVIVILTRFLTKEGYGIYENAFVWFVLLSEMLSLGFGSSIFRYYNLYPDEKRRKEAVSTALLFVVFVCLSANLIIYFVSEPISGLLYGNPSYGKYLLYASVAAGLIVPARLAQVYIRIMERPVFYTFAVLLRVAVILIGIYILVVRMDMGASGAIKSLLISNLVFAALLVPWLVSHIRLSFSMKVLRGMLSFGIPYIPAGISMWALSLCDRYLLTYYTSLEAVGLYSVAYRLGMAMALILAGFQLAWPQFAYSLEHAREGDAVYSRTLTYLFMTMMSAGLLLSLFREELISLVATEEYLQAAYVIPFVAFAYSFEGIYTVTSLGAVFHHRTAYVALTSLIAALTNIVLNVIMIPRFGIAGAAGSTTASYIVLSILMARFSRRFRDVPYEWSRIIKVATVALALIIASFLLHSLLGADSKLLRILCDALLLILFFPLLFLMGFFKGGEILRAVSVISKSVPGSHGRGKR